MTAEIPHRARGVLSGRSMKRVAPPAWLPVAVRAKSRNRASAPAMVAALIFAQVLAAASNVLRTHPLSAGLSDFFLHEMGWLSQVGGT